MSHLLAYNESGDEFAYAMCKLTQHEHMTLHCVCSKQEDRAAEMERLWKNLHRIRLQYFEERKRLFQLQKDELVPKVLIGDASQVGCTYYSPAHAGAGH